MSLPQNTPWAPQDGSCIQPTVGHIPVFLSSLLVCPIPHLAPYKILTHDNSGLRSWHFLYLDWLWSFGRNLLLFQGSPWAFFWGYNGSASPSQNPWHLFVFMHLFVCLSHALTEDYAWHRSDSQGLLTKCRTNEGTNEWPGRTNGVQCYTACRDRAEIWTCLSLAANPLMFTSEQRCHSDSLQVVPS